MRVWNVFLIDAIMLKQLGLISESVNSQKYLLIMLYIVVALELESEILHQGPHDSAVWAVVFVPFFTNQTHDLIKRC